MKKTMKRIAVAGTVLLALFGAGTGIALASGYITWGGTQDYNQTIENLELIGQRIQNLNQTNEQLQNVILDKDNQIDNLNQQIEALEKRIADGQTTQDQLRQAEKDMENVRKKSEEVLSEFN